MMTKKKIVVPVNLEAEPMKRLLVADIEGHSDYLMLEPQLFDDDVNGKGMRVLRYRKDKKVDIYYEPGVVIDPGSFNIGAGIGDLAETRFPVSRFRIDERGADVWFSFTDLQNRIVEMRIRENRQNFERLRFLAPVGKDIANPARLFFAYMLGFDFVMKEGTEFHARIGDAILKPASFPIKMRSGRPYFIRYSSMPLIAAVNPPAEYAFSADASGPGNFKAGRMNVVADVNGKIISIAAAGNGDSIRIDFLNALPNLLDMKDQSFYEGNWGLSIKGDSISGGKYCVRRNRNKAEFGIKVTKNWCPSGLPRSLMIFTSLVRSFKTWPKTYSYHSEIDLDTFKLSGGWSRV